VRLSILVGNGRKIGLLLLPVAIISIASNLLFPKFFSVGGPTPVLVIVSSIVLIPGIINWIWSVALILICVPKKKLITTGPYAVVKHPLYNGVGLLVLPWLGFLSDTWIGVVLGLTIVVGSKLYAREEEAILEKIFKEEWTAYSGKVLIPWL
jgi:protein-S-isoprenylcysteine O-methyltransferase Ste14